MIVLSKLLKPVDAVKIVGVYKREINMQGVTLNVRITFVFSSLHFSIVLVLFT